MIHKSKEFNKRYAFSGYLEEDEHKKLCEIASRENVSASHIGRKAIVEYVAKHLAGNDTYTLNTWVDNNEFMALPALLSSQTKWMKYIGDESSKEELLQVQKQIKFLSTQIESRLLRWEQDSDEYKKTIQRRNDKFRNKNDIRFKDPKTLSVEMQIYRKHLRELSGLEDDTHKG